MGPAKNAKNHAKGVVEEVGGTVKKNVGKLIGNEQMTVEGKATELKGKARQEGAEAAERAEGTVQEIAGALKKNVGKLIGDEQMEMEGKAKELTGKVRRTAAT